MKLFKKPLTLGGFFGICGICFLIILGAVGYAFGFHKTVWEKAKDIKRKLW
jgi:hypothetical protein